MHRRDMPVRRDRSVHHLNRRNEQITTCRTRSARQTTLPPCVAQSQAEDLMNGCHAVPTPVPTERQPEPEIKLAGLGRLPAQTGAASATASTPRST
jgi:hypothetical protein